LVAACLFGGITLLLAPAPLRAELEVTLKSGAILIGNVTIDGDAAVVQINDSQLRVPLQEVAAIASVDSSREHQARRLLLIALEAKLTNDAGKEVIGLLAEAARLAPDDPHIAYWYASSLADAGFGQAASNVLDERRDAIAKAYPGMTDQLAARIKRRVEMEKMPPQLVERIDQLNAAAAHQPVDAEMRQLAAVFRLVDQDERPIERSAFQIQCNGQDEKLESFDDGYFLFTFNQSRHNSEEPCHVEVVQPGLESKTFEFSGASNRVQDAGKLAVRRYDENAKKPFRARLVGSDGQPVSGAQVTLQAVSARGGSSSHALSTESGADGRVEILTYPMKYVYRVQAEGFNHDSGNIELKADDGDADERQIQLHRAIQATIRVAWMTTALQGGGKASGEATLQVDGGPPAPNRYGQDATPWIRPVQVKDRLTLQFAVSPFGYQVPFGPFGPFGGFEPWLRVVESEAGANDEDTKRVALAKFTALDLNKIDELKDEFSPPRNTGGNQPGHPSAPMVLPCELGKVYVGKLTHRDMRTGQPVQLAFKAVVEELSTDSPPAQ
jgi:hypothetical protein